MQMGCVVIHLAGCSGIAAPTTRNREIEAFE